MLSVVPTVTTPTATGITSKAAALGGDVTSDGGSTLTDVGVLYSVTGTNANPKLAGTGVTQISTTAVTGVFTTNVTNLTPGTNYSFVAYATNDAGTTYTPVSTFTSGSNHAPTVSIASAVASSPVIGTTTNLSVLGDDLDTGEASLTYTWSAKGNPPASVFFSINGTNAARNTTVSFTVSGSYQFVVTITDPSGATVTSDTFVAVNTAVKNLPFALYDVPMLPLPYGGMNATLVIPGVSIYDPNSVNLTQATIQITGNYQNGRDVLAVNTVSGITSSFDAASGILTLTGTSSIANYQTSLQSLTYQANSLAASPFTQTITITLDDGMSAASPVIRSISVNSAETTSYSIACLGDSLTFWQNGWISMLQSYYSASNITNFGIGGYTTQQIDNTWETEVRGHGYQMISVLGGVNDIAHGVSAVTTFSYLNSIYDEAMAGGLKIIAFSMTPLGNWYANSSLYWTPQIQVQINAFNAMIAAKAAANPNQMTFVNSYALMGASTDPQSLNPIYNNGDGLHWNLAGHQLMASTFFADFSPNIGLSNVNSSELYVQRTPILMIAQNLVVTEPGGQNLDSAMVSFTNWQGGDRVEFDNSFALQHAFTEDLTAHTAELTLTGSATAAQYELTLQSVAFFSVAGQPNSSITRTATITVNDTLKSASTSENLYVAQYLAGLGPELNDIQGSAPLVIAQNIVITTPALLTLITSATVLFTNWQGEDRLAFYNSLAMQHTFTEDLVAHTATLTLTGSATVFGWQTLLRSVTYQDVAGQPYTSAMRVVMLTVSDGTNIASASENIIVVSVNQPPLVQVNDSTELRYPANSPPIAIMSLALVSDPDSYNLSSLTVQITSGFNTGQDILSFATQLGITGSFNSRTGMLTLSGLSYVGNYRQALRAVTFNTSGSVVSTTTRTFTVIAIDDTNVPSIPVTRSLFVTR